MSALIHSVKKECSQVAVLYQVVVLWHLDTNRLFLNFLSSLISKWLFILRWVLKYFSHCTVRLCYYLLHSAQLDLSGLISDWERIPYILLAEFPGCSLYLSILACLLRLYQFPLWINLRFQMLTSRFHYDHGHHPNWPNLKPLKIWSSSYKPHLQRMTESC